MEHTIGEKNTIHVNIDVDKVKHNSKKNISHNKNFVENERQAKTSIKF